MAISTAIINTTKQVVLNVTNHLTNPLTSISNGTTNVSVYYQDQYTIWLVIATAGVAIATWHMAKTNRDEQRRQHQKSGLLDVFSMLNNPDHKKAEEIIRIAYTDKENPLYTGQMINQAYKDYMNTVSRNYDQIGLLIKRDLVPNLDYYRMYGTMTVVYHHILFMEINRHREALGERDFRTFFTYLAVKCYEYWKKQNRIPTDPSTNQTIPQFVVDKWKESLPPYYE